MSDPVAPEGLDTSTGEVTQSEPFFVLDETTSFNTPDELRKAFQEGTLRHSEDKRRMSEYQENMKRFENERSGFYKQMSDYEEKVKIYKQLDEIMKSNPAAYRRMMEVVQQEPQGEDLMKKVEDRMEKRYGSKLKKLEDEERRRIAAEERDKHFKSLSGRYPDLDKDAVQAEWDRLMSPESSMETLLEIIYHSLKGKNPQKLEERAAENFAKKQAAAIPTQRGAAPPLAKKADEDAASIDELRETLKLKKRGGNK